MKSSGGLIRGTGLTDNKLVNWIATMLMIMGISKKVENFCDVSFCTTEQCVDL